MNFQESLKKRVLKADGSQFVELALELYRFQAEQNPVYKEYLKHLNRDPRQAETLEQITFLPIEFFKSHTISTGTFTPETTFKSSGTTQQSRSQHLVADLEFYHHNAKAIFERFYGNLQDFIILALLPSYLEQGESSLVAMVQHFVEQTGQEEQGFYLHNHQELLRNIETARKSHKKILLIGVTYALLDLAEQNPGLYLNDIIIMETGGMKGRRREMIREELHQQLQEAFKVEAIHSEYGMTELLSQAYSSGNGIFELPPQMRILLRDPNDPFDIGTRHRSGGINVIDLANVDSCAFIETKDLGKIHPDGTFEVLGRFDNADIRGCNLMVAT